MKTILLAIALLLSLIAAPLRAQDDVSPAIRTNDSPTAVAKGDDVQPSVRIDTTGIHVGGENPVDINVPNTGGGIGGIVGPLLPIISVLAVFGMPVAIVGFVLYFKHRRNRMLHETLRAMVEKGVPIPPELISGHGASSANVANAESRGNKDLRAGLIVSGVGIGLMILVGKPGLIPLFIGVALIISWLITNRSRHNQAPQ